MNPTADVKTTTFSPCTQRDICANFPALGHCLIPAPGNLHVMSISMCGNGLKEAGEECDCGSPADCAKDSCCDGATCKLKNGAQCDDLNDSCCKGCRIMSSGTVCRPAISVCDTPEICTGTSPDCPADTTVEDGTECKVPGQATTGLYCASGYCTSRDQQCRTQTTQRLNFAGACPTTTVGSTCHLTCQDGVNPPNCFQLSGVFLDGTHCGNGGVCVAGTCQGDSIWNFILTMVKRHAWIAIIVSCIVGVIVLGFLIQFIRRWRARRVYLNSIKPRGDTTIVSAPAPPMVISGPINPYHGGAYGRGNLGVTAITATTTLGQAGRGGNELGIPVSECGPRIGANQWR